MAELTPVPTGNSPAAHPLSLVELSAAVDRWLNPVARYPSGASGEPDHVVRRATLPLSDAAKAEAARQMAELAATLQAMIDRAELRRWLLAMNAGFRNPLGEADFDNRLAAFTIVFCGEWPAVLFCEQTQRLVLTGARNGFWPAASDVVAILEPLRDRMTQTLAALAHLVRGEPAPEREWERAAEHAEPSELPPERRAAVDETLRQLHAGMTLGGQPREREQRPTARYLTPAEFRAVYATAKSSGRLLVPIPEYEETQP